MAAHPANIFSHSLTAGVIRERKLVLKAVPCTAEGDSKEIETFPQENGEGSRIFGGVALRRPPTHGRPGRASPLSMYHQRNVLYEFLAVGGLEPGPVGTLHRSPDEL